ncbi:MAG TPA: folylpolyglutamate synthase/dihydrofolate synthase family protein [Vicinamibacterales bacterium]|nr:folylpolyglutamate synthase/dihydrofolate synthase family protein [Vicinamibacterales bacterium]
MSDRSFLDSLEIIGIKLGLDQIRALCEQLDRPQDSFRSIVVAGTNGKGSVTAMVERGLRAAGYRTGRYTSPHLAHLEERFAIDGVSVPANVLDEVLGRVQSAATKLPAPSSYFEATTAAAFEIFRDGQVDVAVLEVGLGGRLDATNVVTPIAVAITAIDFDHQAYLGDTIEAIAREKAGVIKPDCLTVLAINPKAVREVVRATCEQQGASLVYAPDGVAIDARIVDGATTLSLTTPRGTHAGLSLALRGRHQIDNAVTAVRLLEELAASDRLSVPAGAIRSALADVEWPARLELIRWNGHEVLIDGAHNPAGAHALAWHLQETYDHRVPMVVGIMRDKNIGQMIQSLAPAASHFIFTASATGRASSPSDLVRAAAHIAPYVPAVEFARPSDALRHAVTLGQPAVVAGSLYLAGEIRADIS